MVHATPGNFSAIPRERWWLFSLLDSLDLFGHQWAIIKAPFGWIYHVQGIKHSFFDLASKQCHGSKSSTNLYGEVGKRNGWAGITARDSACRA